MAIKSGEGILGCPDKVEPGRRFDAGAFQRQVMEACGTLPDSGKRENFVTGSVRDTREGKGRFDLIPIHVLRRLANHFEIGGRKYADRNWEKGQQLMRYYDSAMRHLTTHIDSVSYGKAEVEDNLSGALWNIVCLMQTEQWIKEGILPRELNDIPVYRPALIPFVEEM